MKKSELKKIVKEIIQELSATNVGGASFSPGQGEQYATPHAFRKGTGDNRATKFAKKLGYTKVQRPTRPSHTKLFDYLNEHTD